MVLPDLARIMLPVVYSQINPADPTFESGIPARNSLDLLNCRPQTCTIFDGLAQNIDWQVDDGQVLLKYFASSDHMLTLV